MIDTPSVHLEVEPAKEWSITGPGAERAATIAKQLTDTSHRVDMLACSAEHVGLGVGTQLSLALGRALQPAWATSTTARYLGRGQRSAIGCFGFDHGGLIIEAGKRPGEADSTLIGAYRLPESWRVLLVIPRQSGRWSGSAERQAFQTIHHHGMPESWTDRMARLALLGIAPSALECDLLNFGEAVHEYNRMAGEPYRDIQGGVYSRPAITSAIQTLRGMGLAGVGQSSWGPTIFAIVGDPEQAEWHATAIRQQLLCEVSTASIYYPLPHANT